MFTLNHFLNMPFRCKLLNLKNVKRKVPPRAVRKASKKTRLSKTGKKDAEDDDVGEPEETESVEKAVPDPKPDPKSKAAAPKQSGRKAGNPSKGSDEAKAKLLEKLMAASG